MDLHESDSQTTQHKEPLPSKRLTRKSQMAILMLVVGFGVAIFLIGPAIVHQIMGTPTAEPATETAAASEAGTFKVTDRRHSRS
jgi:hypothetical protein